MFDENTQTIAVLLATVLLVGTAVVPAVGLGDTDIDTPRDSDDEATNTTTTASPSPTAPASEHRSPVHQPNNTTDDPERLRTPFERFLDHFFGERGIDTEVPEIVPPGPPTRDDNDRRPPATTSEKPTTIEETETTPTEQAELDSFDVSGLDAPDSASVGDTIDVSATISNPNDRQLTQSVAFRFEGVIVDRRSVTLAAGESATVTFEFDTGRITTDAYNYNAFLHGVYTREHGELATIELNDPAATTEPTAIPTTETSTPTETPTSTTDTPTTTDSTPEPTTPTETTEETTTETITDTTTTETPTTTTTTETTTDTTTTAPATTTTATEVPAPTTTTVETTTPEPTPTETTTTETTVETTTTEATTTTTTSESSYAERLEQELHEEINRLRRERGLAPLSYSATLEEVADYHSRDMADRDYFAHTGPDGETVSDRYDRFGVSCQRWGENILYNYYSDLSPERAAQKSVQQWMNSDGHRRNILSENWDSEGIGVYVDEDGRLYVTQNFGTDCST